MARQVVFYSWQSWSDAASNRNFIQDCLERAIKAIRKDDSLTLDPVVDRDTLGVPGSPDIADTIFEKIAAADAFVADVSFVHDSLTPRRTPNPNVLVELGYALGALGKKKLICVLNTATGRIEDLPFDVRGRRMAAYHLPPRPEGADEEAWRATRAAEREKCVGLLKDAIVAIMSASNPALDQLVSEVTEQVIRIIIFGGEVEDRPIKPGSEEVRIVFDAAAGELRRLACQSVAVREGIAAPLSELVAALDEVLGFRRFLGRENWDAYLALVRKAADLATRVKAEWIDPHPLGRENMAAIHRQLFELRMELDGVVARLGTLLRRPGGLGEVQDEASRVGLDLCRFAQFNLDKIQPGLAGRLRPVGRALHLLNAALDYTRGTNGANAVTAEHLEKFAREFGELVDALPPAR